MNIKEYVDDKTIKLDIVTVKYELIPSHLPGRSPSIIETTSDDHTALQTLPVSIKKLICVFRTLSSLDLKEFTDVASTALDGKLFHLLITLSEKK